jgi:hypothetical protein
MKQYHPSMSDKAEQLYTEGKYINCIELAIEAHNKAKQDAEEEWEKLLKGDFPSKLAKMTSMSMWDTTTQQYLTYDDYIKAHNWHDDIPPGLLRIAAKAMRKLAKNALKKNDYTTAIKYFLEIEKIGEMTESDKKTLEKIR